MSLISFFILLENLTQFWSTLFEILPVLQSAKLVYTKLNNMWASNCTDIITDLFHYVVSCRIPCTLVTKVVFFWFPWLKYLGNPSFVFKLDENESAVSSVLYKFIWTSTITYFYKLWTAKYFINAYMHYQTNFRKELFLKNSTCCKQLSYDLS